MNRFITTLAFGLLIGSVVADELPKRLAPGTKWESPVEVIDSGQPGPTVLMTAGLHGNEPAGPAAAHQIQHWSLKRGRLILLPRCNPPALLAAKRKMPTDLNRDFPKDAGPATPSRQPAKAIWDFVAELKPDYLLDLHEGYGRRGAGSKSVGTSVIRLPHPKAEVIQDVILEAVNRDLDESETPFVPLTGRTPGMLATAAAQRLNTCALICETTYKEPYLACRTRRHRIMVHALLQHLDMVRHGPHVLTPKATDRVRVALYDGPGSGPSKTSVVKLLKNDELLFRRVDPRDIRDGVLTQFDLVVFPGGSGSKQGAELNPDGRDAVRAFVADGGGCIGICAGAYLLTSHYRWSLNVLNAASVDTRHWRRGNAMLEMALTDPGRDLFKRGDAEKVDISFRQGPILGPGVATNLPPYEVLGHFLTGVGKNGADPKTMVGAPAIIRAPFGGGRALAFSPHPELTKGLEDFLMHAVKWCVDDAAH